MSLSRNFTIVGSATLLSRLSGFVRDMLIAAILGTGVVADAYVAAFLLPNFFRRIISEGAFNAAFVPIFARKQAEEGDAAARRFADSSFSGLLAVVLVMVLVLEVLMPGLIRLIAPGFRSFPEKFAYTVDFGRVAFLFVAFVILTALISAVMNVIGRFALVAFAPLLLNLALILTLLVLLGMDVRGTRNAGFALVITVALAGLAQLVYVYWGTIRAGFRLKIVRPRREPDVARLLLMALPGLIIAGSGHFNMLVAAQMSSDLPGTVARLYYADRVFQLPLGFVAAAIGVVLLPAMSSSIRSGNRNEAVASQSRAVEFGFLLILPATFALMILSAPIINILYQHGAFTADDSARTAAILAILAFALPGFVLIKLFIPMFLAREAMRWPLLAVILGVGANIVVTLALKQQYGALAAAFGVSLAAWVNAMALAVFQIFQGGIHLDADARHRLPRIILSALITAAVTYLLEMLREAALLPDDPFLFRAGALGLICLAGIATHLIAIQATGAADLLALRALLKRKAT